MKISLRSFILAIVTGALLLTALVLLIVALAPTPLADNPIFRIVFLTGTLLFTAAFMISMVNIYSQRTLIKTLEIENEYNIGHKSSFNNLYAFQEKASILANSRFRRKQNQHIIVFTVSNLSVSQNVNRNNELMVLNSHIVEYLENFYKTIGVSRRDFIFGFNRGSFLIFSFKQTEASIQDIIDNLTKDIYDCAQVHCPHLWVQPFFGVAIVEKNQPIMYQIENALLARDFSERNFETTTYYQTSFRRSVSSNEAEELEQALEKKEFIVFYQPKFDLNNRTFISSEALIRWNSKKYGLLAPTKFLSKAESIGLIHEIDVYVLRKVCEDLNDLRRRGRRVLPVSVNFSLFEFYSASFLDRIMATLKEFDIPTNLIEIEITEATSQANQFLSISIIKKLKDLGIRVLMDDFGVGFSNVGNLQKIPFDVVKIDKSFIDNIVVDSKAREIVKFLIGLCKVNGMEVVAEGVDNKEQMEILKKMKCDTIQGFYYSKALSKAEFEKFLANNPFEKKGANN